MELTKEYKDRFKFTPPITLFEPTWDALKENRCPMCLIKLKIPLKGKVAMCKKRHFVIAKNKLVC